MTGPELSTALQTLGLDTQAAAKWLGVSVRAVQRYRVSGAPGPVAGMVRERMERIVLERRIAVMRELLTEEQERSLSYLGELNNLARDWRE